MPASPKDHQKKQPTSAKSWKSKASKPAEVELPSGNVALVRRMPITKMLTSGVLPDSLRPIIMDSIKEGKDAEDMDMSKLMSDDKALESMFESFDKVLVACVVEPKVSTPPENEEDRDDEILYADEVDLDDKIFIFQYAVGGEEDLDDFRSGS